MIRKLWPPDGIQPGTDEPEFNIRENTESGTQVVTLSSSTPGASIAYMLDDSEHWLLYSKPFEVSDEVKVSSQAIRIGYKPSEIVIK